MRYFFQFMVIFALHIALPNNTYAEESTNRAVKGLEIDNELRVGLISDGRKPYFWRDQNGKPQGIYIALLEEISTQLEETISYQFLPQARIRLYMKHAYLDIEPGIAEGWRTEPLEIESSVYSVPFLESDEVYVYNRNHNLSAFPTADELYPLKRCTIIGFNKFDLLESNVDKEVRTESQMLEMLNRQRCDYIVMPKLVFDFWANNRKHNLATTETIATYQLRLRIQKDKQYLLPAINTVITNMLNKGKIRQLINTTFALDGKEIMHETK